MVEVRKAKGDTLEFHKVHQTKAGQLLLSFAYPSGFEKEKVVKMIHLCFLWSVMLQFYKNLSTCLEDVVWKTEEDMQEMK